MSRLWNRARLRVYVADDHLAAVRLSGDWRPEVLEKSMLPFAPGEMRAVLEGWWRAQPAHADLELVLSASHVRYVVLSWNPQLVRATFRDAMTQALLARQFPEAMSQPVIRYGRLQYSQPLLVACLDARLLAEMQGVAEAVGGRLASVQPLLMTVWNHFGKGLGKLQGDVFILEAQRVLRVGHCKGHITSLQLRPLLAEAIAPLLEQSGEAAASFRVFAPLLPGIARHHAGRRLDMAGTGGVMAGGPDAFAYALCGVT